MKQFVPLFLPILLCAGCGLKKFEKMTDRPFADQYFKTAISLIELHKIRYGQYPPSLDSLTFKGDWDNLIYSYVKYEKLDTGYRLDVVNGMTGATPELQYPEAFWQGLGLKASNVLHLNPKEK